MENEVLMYSVFKHDPRVGLGFWTNEAPQETNGWQVLSEQDAIEDFMTETLSGGRVEPLATDPRFLVMTDDSFTPSTEGQK